MQGTFSEANGDCRLPYKTTKMKRITPVGCQTVSSRKLGHTAGKHSKTFESLSTAYGRQVLNRPREVELVKVN